MVLKVKEKTKKEKGNIQQNGLWMNRGVRKSTRDGVKN